ncbi:hypothetical protein D3C85_1711900 [compost metagenome]
MLERILEFAEAIGRVDIDQHHANLGAGELGDAPLGTVRRPDAKAFARLHADGQQGTGTAIHRFTQLAPAIT